MKTSRRTLVKGAAWATPIVIATAGIPAYAASHESNLKALSVDGPGTSGEGFMCEKPYYEGSGIPLYDYNKDSYMTMTGVWINDSDTDVPAGVTLWGRYMTQDFFYQAQFVSATLNGSPLQYTNLRYSFNNYTEGKATSDRIIFNDGEISKGQNPGVLITTSEAIPPGGQIVLVYKVRFQEISGWDAPNARYMSPDDVEKWRPQVGGYPMIYHFAYTGETNTTNADNSKSNSTAYYANYNETCGQPWPLY